MRETFLDKTNTHIKMDKTNTHIEMDKTNTHIKMVKTRGCTTFPKIPNLFREPALIRINIGASILFYFINL